MARFCNHLDVFLDRLGRIDYIKSFEDSSWTSRTDSGREHPDAVAGYATELRGQTR